MRFLILLYSSLRNKNSITDLFKHIKFLISIMFKHEYIFKDFFFFGYSYVDLSLIQIKIQIFENQKESIPTHMITITTDSK